MIRKGFIFSIIPMKLPILARFELEPIDFFLHECIHKKMMDETASLHSIVLVTSVQKYLFLTSSRLFQHWKREQFPQDLFRNLEFEDEEKKEELQAENYVEKD